MTKVKHNNYLKNINMSYNRYTNLIINDEVKNIPFIKLKNKSSDKEDVYKIGNTRFDILSDKYYKNPNYGWLILLANPTIGNLEFKIEDNTPIRIPFPLEETLKNYKEEVIKYITYYGI